MKIYLGSDHRGFLLKEKVFAYLAKYNYEVEDVGGRELNPDDDFPQFAAQAAVKVLGEGEKTDPRAILICTSGQGMAMAANRVKGVRAAVVYDVLPAVLSKEHNNANVLCTGAWMVTPEIAFKMIDVWLMVQYNGL